MTGLKRAAEVVVLVITAPFLLAYGLACFVLGRGGDQ